MSISQKSYQPSNSPIQEDWMVRPDDPCLARTDTGINGRLEKKKLAGHLFDVEIVEYESRNQTSRYDLLKNQTETIN